MEIDYEIDNVRETRLDRKLPKLPYQMTKDEILERMKQVNKRMARAVQNYEFYYYEELKSEMQDLKKELKIREENTP
ncbi:hypothetical protein [Heyndrickxia sporothermodurans]|uniref:hypothetical protein n=1 Tax=Heyndrickxia sporothermodurans TaxID=46224 RepID=UPI000D3636D9|nr:hypothetical protein [Heyndrickxia sporothermodurans]PTY92943.1 hypothetical protein B5V90_02360 [Heyndrickxia sporothermodurans]